jgi:lipopolysaccharide/colanic/teichoic acid biosynthesis glycosyltransferase
LKTREPAGGAANISKRALDIALASLGLLLSSPVLLPILFLVWLQDRHSPFYVADRVGGGGTPFRLVKIRSMVRGADRSGVDSTAATDPRITPLGRFLRSYKLDELPQLWNVLKGDMSLVGPRPNVRRDVDLYTDLEQRLLSVKPGMTDLASIVFADEGEILRESADPDLEYNRLIRPWKSRLGLFYIDHRSMGLDVALILLTLVAIASRPAALRWLQLVLMARGADRRLVEVAARNAPLVPHPPPGSLEVVRSRVLAS